MAGNYPDTPGRRMPWDTDGTILVRVDPSNNITTRTAQDRANLNDESDSSFASGNTNGYQVAIFPELRELDGLFLASNYTGRHNQVESSVDTTNGLDGTWVTEFANYPETWTGVPVNYRNHIQSMAANAKRSLRYWFSDGQAQQAFHIYGEISPGETPDRLLFIDDNTGLEFTGPIDYGNTPRGGSEDRDIRIKNNSATLTANTIQYTASALTGSSGGWYTFTTPGGGSFSATQQIASLAPATTTDIITLRRITPGSAGLGLAAARISAVTTSFT